MTLKILTLNLWHDSGPYEARAKRIREWVDRLDPDLIGFQEALRGGGRDQVEELLDGRGYHTDYVCAAKFPRRPREAAEGAEAADNSPRSGRSEGMEFGNAVASRWPIIDREELRLPDSGDGETRAALSVTIDAPFGPVGFTCTHLNWKFRHSAVREKQVVALCDLALRQRPKVGRERRPEAPKRPTTARVAGGQKGGFPPIVVGDFNAEPESSEIRYVTGLQSLAGRSISLVDAWRMAGDGGPGITWSNRNPYAATALEPDRRIDYIFAGFPRQDAVGQITTCRVVCDDEVGDVWPSDHFGVYAELRTEAVPGREDQWGLAGGDDAGS